MGQSSIDYIDCNAIQRALWKKYKKQIGVNVFNKHIYEWESDFLRVNRNEYSLEYEIKLSREDFKADLRKVEKHKMLQYPMKYTAHKYIYDCMDRRFTEVVFKFSIVPNKFYYICPTDIIGKNEVPAYAGLVYVNKFETLEVIKEAPLLHKVKFPKELYKDIASKLSSKVKYHFMDSDVNKIKQQSLEIKRLEEEIKKISSENTENSNVLFYFDKFRNELLSEKGRQYLSGDFSQRIDITRELRKQKNG